MTAAIWVIEVPFLRDPSRPAIAQMGSDRDAIACIDADNALLDTTWRALAGHWLADTV